MLFFVKKKRGEPKFTWLLKYIIYRTDNSISVGSEAKQAKRLSTLGGADCESSDKVAFSWATSWSIHEDILPLLDDGA